MTNSITPANNKRPSSGGSLTWKSGVLAVSLAAVLAGSALVARLDQLATPKAQTVEPAARATPTAQSNTQTGSTQSRRTVRLAPLPSQPLFQQPVTRTRRS